MLGLIRRRRRRKHITSPLPHLTQQIRNDITLIGNKGKQLRNQSIQVGLNLTTATLTQHQDQVLHYSLTGHLQPFPRLATLQPPLPLAQMGIVSFAMLSTLRHRIRHFHQISYHPLPRQCLCHLQQISEYPLARLFYALFPL